MQAPDHAILCTHEIENLRWLDLPASWVTSVNADNLKSVFHRKSLRGFSIKGDCEIPYNALKKALLSCSDRVLGATLPIFYTNLSTAKEAGNRGDCESDQSEVNLPIFPNLEFTIVCQSDDANSSTPPASAASSWLNTGAHFFSKYDIILICIMCASNMSKTKHRVRYRWRAASYHAQRFPTS